MSDYKIENREEVVATLQNRVVENAPLKEIARVYAEAVSSAIASLSDADVVRSIVQANYGDLIEYFSLEIPPAPGETPGSETEGAGGGATAG